MKNSMLVLLALILGFSQLYGQDQRQRNHNPEVRIQKIVDGFSEKVNLSDDQKAGMTKVLLTHHQERRALGKDADKQQRMDLRSKKSTELQKVLGNEETYKAYTEYMKENRKSYRQNRHKRGARSGGEIQQRKRQGMDGQTRPSPERRQGNN